MSKQFRSRKYWWIHRREKLLFLFFLAIFFLITPRQEGEIAIAAFPEFSFTKQESIPIPSPALYPINISNEKPPAEVTAYAIHIVDVASGVALYKKNETIPLPPASTTKLMTALVALDVFKLSDIVTVKESTVSGQRMNLVVNERITVENLLYGMLIHSGNDAAEQVAFHYPQGYQAFVQLMNEKAKTIHLEHSSFTNVVGWDDTNHRMSAKDLSRLARVAIENPLIAKIVNIPEITVSDVDSTIYHKLKTTNQLLGKVRGVSGIKTGYTQEAGQNLVSMVQRDGKKVIIVVMRSQDRFADTTLLINWVFANFQWIPHGI
ncbi:MAG: D-alanyl-D-alanine carboxypeptidase [Patescibacteria group bacterium]|nr:D-alanyl-D-alanine carboxypeptidase [Patescibacteria group bacterium]